MHRQPTPSPPRRVEASSQASVLAHPPSCSLFTTTAATIPTASHTVTTNAACTQATMPTSAHPTVPTSTDKNMANFHNAFLRLSLLLSN
ncbi:unnamed protein product [Taenia asiatica]|uniref:Uncharacterized protein n=1 Tax=Taenia asiatica TaxID=60517 RepID=A0A0R3WGW9_TAEAS|nr:unnamed protein product [Taenia asiatica]